jgi:hypothetical protein
MSFQLDKGDILPPLQKRLVLFLANNDPQTVNQVVKALKGSYKSFWTAHNSLKDKHLVQAVSVKSYRGREYPCFWVSPAGVLLALFDGVSAEVLLERSLKIYPKDANLQAILEISPIVGYEAFELGFQAILAKGKLDQADIAAIILTVAQKNFDMSQLAPLLAILKKHPEQLESTKVYAKEMSDKIAKIQSLFNEKK